MLYDPKWKKKQLILEALACWLETKPKDGCYTDFNPANCLVAEFLGRKAPAVLPEHIACVVYLGEHTYGAALDRARKSLRMGS
jgi:hypothetical protein